MRNRSLNEWLLLLYILKLDPDGYSTSFVWWNPITYVYLVLMLIYLCIKLAIFGKDCKLN